MCNIVYTLFTLYILSFMGPSYPECKHLFVLRLQSFWPDAWFCPKVTNPLARNEHVVTHEFNPITERRAPTNHVPDVFLPWAETWLRLKTPTKKDIAASYKKTGYLEKIMLCTSAGGQAGRPLTRSAGRSRSSPFSMPWGGDWTQTCPWQLPSVCEGCTMKQAAHRCKAVGWPFPHFPFMLLQHCESPP